MSTRDDSRLQLPFENRDSFGEEYPEMTMLIQMVHAFVAGKCTGAGNRGD
jgi:hypothetical protein